MADKFEIKVNYVRLTEYGLEEYNDVDFDDLTHEDKMDIKSLIFLPVNSRVMLDITPMLKDFPFLENLYLPSMMTTSFEDIAGECPMLKNLVLLSHNSIVDSMEYSAVRINSRQSDGENYTQYKAFVDVDKKGRQTFLINTEHVDNHEIIVKDENTSRLTLSQIRDLVSGENGVLQNIEEINSRLSDPKYRIDIGKETLESLFEIFVEKGVTFEEFTIDFSKMCDKIESYKALSKNVNQVSIKEDVEASIVQTYRRILDIHYNGVVGNLAKRIEKLIKGTTTESESTLLADLKNNVVSVLVDHPDFDEDYKLGNTLDEILLDISTMIAKSIKSSRIRSLARKYMAEVVTDFKENKNDLISLIEAKLKNHADIEKITQIFADGLGLDLKKKQQSKFACDIVDVLVSKNLGSITVEDVRGIFDGLKEKMGKEELRPKEILELLKDFVKEYPTKEEINNALVDFIEKKGYSSIKFN